MKVGVRRSVEICSVGTVPYSFSSARTRTIDPRTNYLGQPKIQDTRSHPPGINLWYDGSALASLCLGKDAPKSGHLIECLLARRLQSHSARQKHIQGFYG